MLLLLRCQMGDERLHWQQLSQQLNIKSNELQKTAKRTLNDEEQEAVCLRRCLVGEEEVQV